MRYEVSCPELDFLVQLLKDAPHVLGSRMMGGGFGGCTINIVYSAHQEEIRQFVKQEYAGKFGLTTDIYGVKLVNGAERF